MSDSEALTEELARRALSRWEPPGLDPARVLGILRRAAAHRSEHVRGFEHVIACRLREAVKAMGGERVLEVYEREDLVTLDRNLLLTRRLADPNLPLYSLPEFADLVAAFRGFLEENREPILATGRPRAPFTSSPWLNRRLAALYYLSIAGRGSSSPVGTPDIRHLDRWAFHEAIGERRHDRGTGMLRIDPEDAVRVAEGREKLLDLKLRILQRLEPALRKGNAEGVWEECFTHVVKTCSREEADFYLRQDRFYRDVDARAKHVAGPEPGVVGSTTLPGGLSDLLEVVGQCECEIRFRTLAGTKEDFVRAAEQLGLSGWRDLLGESYYDKLESPLRSALDLVLERHWARESDPEPWRFWVAFRQRVNQAIEGELDRDVVVRTRLKQKFRERFVPFMEGIGEAVKSRLEDTGALPDVEIGDAFVRPRGNVLRREGKAWIVTFEGKGIELGGLLGHRYLAELIESAGREISAAELRVRVGRRPATEDANPEQMGLIAQGEMTPEDGAPMGEAIDARTRAACELRIRTLEAKIETEERRGDQILVAKHKSEKEELAAYLKSATGLQGRTRLMGGQPERDRKSVSSAIDYALAQIEKDHPALSEHLQASLRRGTKFAYQPGSRGIVTI